MIELLASNALILAFAVAIWRYSLTRRLERLKADLQAEVESHKSILKRSLDKDLENHKAQLAQARHQAESDGARSNEVRLRIHDRRASAIEELYSSLVDVVVTAGFAGTRGPESERQWERFVAFTDRLKRARRTILASRIYLSPSEVEQCSGLLSLASNAVLAAQAAREAGAAAEEEWDPIDGNDGSVHELEGRIESLAELLGRSIRRESAAA